MCARGAPIATLGAGASAELSPSLAADLQSLMAAATASLPSGVGSDDAGGASDGSSEATLLFEMIVFDWRPSSSMLRSRSSTNWSVVTFLYASAVFSPREMRPTRYFLVDSASATNVSRSAVTLVSVSASNRFFSPSPTIFVRRSAASTAHSPALYVFGGRSGSQLLNDLLTQVPPLTSRGEASTSSWWLGEATSWRNGDE